jgi:hypothetical protein
MNWKFWHKKVSPHPMEVLAEMDRNARRTLELYGRAVEVVRQDHPDLNICGYAVLLIRRYSDLTYTEAAEDIIRSCNSDLAEITAIRDKVSSDLAGYIGKSK